MNIQHNITTLSYITTHCSPYNQSETIETQTQQISFSYFWYIFKFKLCGKYNQCDFYDSMYVYGCLREKEVYTAPELVCKFKF